MYQIRSSNHGNDWVGVHYRWRSLEWHVPESSPLYRLYVVIVEGCECSRAARVIVGIGGGITKVAAPALLHELAHPRLRATMGTMYYGFYHFGGAVSGVMCSTSLLPGIAVEANKKSRGCLSQTPNGNGECHASFKSLAP
jgi:hypothetical protein